MTPPLTFNQGQKLLFFGVEWGVCPVVAQHA